jgi:hypothetical protein
MVALKVKEESAKVDKSAEEEVAARDKAVADRIERKEAELKAQEEARAARIARKKAEIGEVEAEKEAEEEEDAS